LLIVLFLLFQLFNWLLVPGIYSGRPSPRTRQALEAHVHDSPDKLHAAVYAAIQLDWADARRWDNFKFTLFIGADAALIYLFWNYGYKKPSV
jgi:hypothetical protein